MVSSRAIKYAAELRWWDDEMLALAVGGVSMFLRKGNDSISNDSMPPDDRGSDLVLVQVR